MMSQICDALNNGGRICVPRLHKAMELDSSKSSSVGLAVFSHLADSDCSSICVQLTECIRVVWSCILHLLKLKVSC